tara:strand:- start:1706 stop:2110 length:405 start_codon:yes stop_codon:yes gene_type:complete
MHPEPEPELQLMYGPYIVNDTYGNTIEIDQYDSNANYLGDIYLDTWADTYLSQNELYCVVLDSSGNVTHQLIIESFEDDFMFMYGGGSLYWQFNAATVDSSGNSNNDSSSANDNINQGDTIYCFIGYQNMINYN